MQYHFFHMPNHITSDTFSAFEQLTAFTSQIFFTYDIDNQSFTYLNSAFEQIWGMSREDVEERPLFILDNIHPEDRGCIIRSFTRLIKTKKEKNIEFRIQLSDKSVKWLCLSAVMSEQESEGRLIVGCIEDKTANKEKNALLKSSLAQKASILEIIAHDLAGPLNNIQGLSSAVADESKQYQNTELDWMIGKIAETSERSICLISDYLTQEFLESTTVELIKKRVDIVKKLREIINQYKSAEDNIAKAFNFNSRQEKVYAKIDVFKITQVINNLISNAIKFTPDGGVVNLYVEEKEEVVLFIVADNGVGIPADQQEGLFEKFTKARRKGLKGEPSTGLGMSIIKTIVEWHDGKIWFESEESKGTTFFIELPKE